MQGQGFFFSYACPRFGKSLNDKQGLLSHLFPMHPFSTPCIENEWAKTSTICRMEIDGVSVI